MDGTDIINGALSAERLGEVVPSRSSSSAPLPELPQQRGMPRPAHDYKIGDRVRLSTSGKARSPRSISKGQIVSLVARKTGYGSVRVLWDGLKAPRRLHTSFIELDADGAS